MISSIRIVEDFVANRGVSSMTRDDIHRSWQCLRYNGERKIRTRSLVLIPVIN